MCVIQMDMFFLKGTTASNLIISDLQRSIFRSCDKVLWIAGLFRSFCCKLSGTFFSRRNCQRHSTITGQHSCQFDSALIMIGSAVRPLVGLDWTSPDFRRELAEYGSADSSLWCCKGYAWGCCLMSAVQESASRYLLVCHQPFLIRFPN